MPVRGRNITVEMPIGRSYNGEILTGVAYGRKSLDVTTCIDDGGHYGYPDFPANTDVGGAFIRYGQEQYYNWTPSNHIWRGGPNDASYNGAFYVPITGLTGSESAFSGTAWGPTAYRRMKPTKPLYDLGTSLGEIKDLPKQIMRMKQLYSFNGLKDLGNFHLALQFGWLSLLRDTRNMVEMQKQISSRLKWLLRHNGKPVRRRVELATNKSDPVIASGTAYGALAPVLVTQFYAKQPTWQIKEHTESRVWAAARFRYWLPPGPRDIEWTRKMMGRLYGAKPTPAMVYNLIPWSWLVDYFSNLGDVIDNLDVGVADRLAADYFYLMGESAKVKQQDAVGYFIDLQKNPIVVSATSTARRFRKTRLHGDPFGFGTKQQDLSAMQLSILGALGVSRLL